MKQLAMQPILDQLCEGINALQLNDPIVIGIHTGGAWIAEVLHDQLGIQSPLGTLDISFYRDDFSRVGLHPEVKSSSLTTAIDDREIILIDDVLHTGRTIRAAMNEVFSFGRPALVKLAVAIDRPGRELPITADIRGTSIDLAPHQHIKISRHDNELSFNIIDTSTEALP